MTSSDTARKTNEAVGRTRAVAGWLGLAAAPTFALMAGVEAGAASQMRTSSQAPGVAPVGGMVWMYLLMSVFHMRPWLVHASRRARFNQRNPQAEGN